MIKLSLIIPTYNRAEYLEKSLKTFVNQSLNKQSYEIVLVDNNSSDNTKGVFDEFQKKFPGLNWIYFFEPKQGLHYARNRGILLSRGNIIVFGDDDIEASPKWLESIFESFQEDEKTGIVGGPVYPIWDGTPPEWIYDYGTKDIHCVFAYLNYGNESKFLGQEDIFGCNFAIKKQLAVEISGSAPDTFPPHMIHFSGSGEHAMLVKARIKGYKVFYNIEACVRHHAPVSRCTLKYFINRYERWGVENIYHQYNAGSSLLRIFINLCQWCIALMFSLPYHAARKSKNNIKYYAIIMSKQVLFSWKHFIKLIFDPDLRAYTKRTDYLSELDKNRREELSGTE